MHRIYNLTQKSKYAFFKGILVSSRLSTTEETIKVELSKNYELSLFTFLHRNEVEPYVEVLRTCAATFGKCCL